MLQIHHLTLTVSNIEKSKEWYLKLFGDAEVFNLKSDSWDRILLNWPSGVMLGLTQYDGALPNESFSHLKVGLDHVSISCKDEAEVIGWINKLEQLGFGHGPLEDMPFGWAVTARDPDDIPIEFFCPKY